MAGYTIHILFPLDNKGMPRSGHTFPFASKRNYRNYRLNYGITLYSQYVYTGCIELKIYSRYVYTGSIELNIYSQYVYTGSIELTIYSQYVYTGSIQLSIYSQYVLSFAGSNKVKEHIKR